MPVFICSICSFLPHIYSPVIIAILSFREQKNSQRFIRPLFALPLLPLFCTGCPVRTPTPDRFLPGPGRPAPGLHSRTGNHGRGSPSFLIRVPGKLTAQMRASCRNQVKRPFLIPVCTDLSFSVFHQMSLSRFQILQIFTCRYLFPAHISFQGTACLFRKIYGSVPAKPGRREQIYIWIFLFR